MLPVLLLAAAPLPAGAAAPTHLFQPSQCGECHLRASREGTFIRKDAFRADITELCTACHGAEASGMGHRVGMVPSMQVPPDFRLDARGRMTCVTCHDPHAVEKRRRHLLRRKPGAELCTACHVKGRPLRPPPALRVVFPPDNSVVEGGDAVVAGTVVPGAAASVRVGFGGGALDVPVVGGSFAAALRLPEGRSRITLEAGGSTVELTLRSRPRGGNWTPHLTRDTAQCGSCHPGWEEGGFSRSGPVAESCYRCHDRLDRLPHTHRPAALGECSACHDPHGVAPVSSSVAEGGSCALCHDGKGAVRHLKAANAGRGFAVASCAGCHDPHQSTRPALTTSGTESLALAVDLEAPEPRFGFGPEGDLALDLPGFGFTDDPGRPRLPERILSFAVPPGADPRSARLEVLSAETVELPGVFNVAPSPPAAAYVAGRELRNWGQARDVRGGRDEKVYGTDAPWPAAPAALEHGAGFRGLEIVRVGYRPLQFNPVRGTMTLTRRIVAEVQFAPRPQGRLRGILRRALERGAGDLRQLGLANARQVVSWSSVDDPLPAADEAAATGLPGAGGAFASDAGVAGTADFVVVTTRALAAASSGLPSFVAGKTERGFSVKVATEDDYGDVPAGTARAVAIRQWLQGAYGPLGIRFVLLVGNPHPESGDVPMLRAWPRRGAMSNTSYLDAPTDAFYADLTGDWDLDADGFLGEYRDDSGPGGVDFVPEVFVGRIPVYGGDVATLDAILAKIQAYESEPGGAAWRRSVLLPMSFSDSSTDGAWLAEQMKSEFLFGRGFSPWTMYQRGSAGGAVSAFTPDAELRGGAAEARWSVVPYGIVAWWGHGSATRTLVGYTGAWDGDLLAAPAAGLSNAAPAFVYQTACLNAYPESGSNLSYALLKRGAVATVGASRVSWYYVGQRDFRLTGSNAGLGYAYVSRLTSGDPAGMALALAKGDPALPTASETTWMNLMDFNLYGDPSVRLFRGPQLQLSTSALAFVAAEGEADPLEGAFAVSSGAEVLDAGILPEAAWLSGAPVAGRTPTSFKVAVHPGGLARGTHRAQVLVVADAAGNSPLSVPVTLEVTAPGGIAGRVLAADGSPLPGVSVILQGMRHLQSVTDAGGWYRFGSLPPGGYALSVTGTTHPFTGPAPSVTLAAGQHRQVDLQASHLEISGRILNRRLRPARFVPVRLYDSSGVLVRRVRTNRRGYYLFRKLTPGEYVITARRRRLRFLPEEHRVTLAGASLGNLDFGL